MTESQSKTSKLRIIKSASLRIRSFQNYLPVQQYMLKHILPRKHVCNTLQADIYSSLITCLSVYLKMSKMFLVCLTVIKLIKPRIFNLKVWVFQVSIFLTSIKGWYSVLRYSQLVRASKTSYRWCLLTSLHKREMEVNLHKLLAHLGSLLAGLQSVLCQYILMIEIIIKSFT